MKVQLNRSALILAFALAGLGAGSSAFAGAIIGNGAITLGVRDEGHLNLEGNAPDFGNGTRLVGLRLNDPSVDGLSQGCACEGWGVAINSLGVFGSAQLKDGNPVNLEVVKFESIDSKTATSITNMRNSSGSPLLQIKHEFAPLATTPYLYEIIVSITNLTGQPLKHGDLLYRRVIDWNVPTSGREVNSINGIPGLLGLDDKGDGNNVRHVSNNGAQSGNPLSPGDGKSTSGYPGDNLNFTDAIGDNGALFDLTLEALDGGATRQFAMYYGAAPSFALADLARSMVDGDPSDVEVGLYTYGRCAQGVLGGPGSKDCKGMSNEDGSPNVFIFGFGTIDDLNRAGVLAPVIASPAVPVPGALALVGLGAALLAGMRRRRR